MTERGDLGPTGPAKAPKETPKKTYEDKHPNAGNVDGQSIGPGATDDPDEKAGRPDAKTRKRANVSD